MLDFGIIYEIIRILSPKKSLCSLEFSYLDVIFVFKVNMTAYVDLNPKK